MNNERVTTFPFDPTEFPFNIEMSGITNCDNKYEVYREKSYCYILEYVYGGSGTIFCDGREYRVEKGDAYILPKGSCHRYYADNTWDKIWFNVDGTLVSNLIYSYDLQSTVVFKKMSAKMRVLFFGSVALLWAGLAAVFYYLNYEYALLDSLTFLLGFIVPILTWLAYIEYTYLWIVSAVVGLLLNVQMVMNDYSQATYLVYGIYALYCVIGAFVNVQRFYKEQNNNLSAD